MITIISIVTKREAEREGERNACVLDENQNEWV